MKIDNLPKDIKAKLKSNIAKIEKLNNKELLDYSRSVMKHKDDMGEEVTNYLFEAIDNRTEVINSSTIVKEQCAYTEMIEQFIKERR